MAIRRIVPQPEFMRLAIQMAERAKRGGDYCIGAVVVKGGRIIAKAGNSARIRHDSTRHAEMVALERACRSMRRRFLSGCVLYTTAEPCPMCAAAAVWCKLEGVVFGSMLQDMVRFAHDSHSRRFSWRTINLRAHDVIRKGTPMVQIVEGFMREECVALFHE